jgi:hypothetical protein
MNINKVLIESCKASYPAADYEPFGDGIRQTLASLWENSRGFDGGATKAHIFLSAAARAGYTNVEADAFLAAQNPPAPSYDTVGGIVAYEAGELDHEGIIELFQALVDSGMAWQLQGSYGRTVRDLINAGLVNLS